MKHFYFFTIFTLSFFAFCNVQPANDTCATAQTITVDATSTSYSFDINTATINNEEGCSGTTNDYADVWYEFTMPFNGNVYVGGSISWNIFALYDSCGGTELSCFSVSRDFLNIIAGNTYKLRVFRTQAEAGESNFKDFSIVANETLGIETFEKNSVSIYPNPAQSILHIYTNQPIESLTIADINGRTVLNQEFSTKVNVSKLSKGIYFLYLNAKNTSITKKIIIK